MRSSVKAIRWHHAPVFLCSTPLFLACLIVRLVLFKFNGCKKQNGVLCSNATGYKDGERKVVEQEGRADYGSLSRVVLTGTTKQINQTTAKHGDFQGFSCSQAIQERSGKFVSGTVPHPDRWDFDPQRACVDYSGVNIHCKATSGMFELLNKEIGTNVSCLIDNPG